MIPGCPAVFEEWMRCVTPLLRTSSSTTTSWWFLYHLSLVSVRLCSFFHWCSIVCYDSAGRACTKSLFEALKALGMTPDRCGLMFDKFREREVLQLRLCLSW